MAESKLKALGRLLKTDEKDLTENDKEMVKVLYKLGSPFDELTELFPNVFEEIISEEHFKREVLFTFTAMYPVRTSFTMFTHNRETWDEVDKRAKKKALSGDIDWTFDGDGVDEDSLSVFSLQDIS